MTPGGYCEQCLRRTHGEIELGLLELVEYLTRWSEFDEWCDAQGREAA
jgi:hypothetical protein